MQLDYVFDVAMVVDFLKWEKFSFIGHSLGGNLALTYSGLFVEKVKSVFTIESVGAYLWGNISNPVDYTQSLKEFIELQVKFSTDQQFIAKSKRSYTYEDAL